MDNLSTVDKFAGPNVSYIKRSHCITVGEILVLGSSGPITVGEILVLGSSGPITEEVFKGVLLYTYIPTMRMFIRHTGIQL